MLTAEMKMAARLMATREEEDLSYQDIADRVEVHLKTLYNWRGSPEFKEAIASYTDDSLDVDGILVKELQKAPNKGLIELYYKRHGMLRQEDKEEIGSILRMTDEEKEAIEQYVLEKCAE